MHSSLRYFLALTVLAASVSARNVIESGAATSWKYLDEGEPAAGWRDPGFDDAKWKSGKAPLGFGEVKLGTDLGKKSKFVYLRREFDPPVLKSGEEVAILMCMDDAAVVSLNGREIGRVNLPKGPLTVETAPLQVIDDKKEGLYLRFRLPATLFKAGTKNVVGVEMRNADDDLYFDLALKTLPAATEPNVTPAAKEVVNTFNKQHYIGAGVTIPDGYLDGGRGMAVDESARATSGREIIFVDRTKDTEFTNDLAFARDLKSLPIMDRVKKLAEWVAQENTPPGGEKWVGQSTERLQAEFTNKAVLIGDWMDQAHAGVCRHRSLVFKILGDEAGLKTALVRGNYRGTKGAGGHAWNEVTLEDGRRVLVDVMHNGANPKFLELTDPKVIERYLKVDNSPWYAAKAATPSTK